MNFKYITSVNAHQLLQGNRSSILVDVRTKQEWKMHGVPMIDQRVILLSWPLDLQPKSIENFINNLKNSIKNLLELKQINTDKQIELFFICKAGARSALAAHYADSLGFKQCYNIIDGFEGSDQNSSWKNNSLPWQQI